MTGLRVVIAGAGIVGLAHAWMAARRGHDVTVVERSARAVGASVRNFGMIWPIGQKAGQVHQTALRSRDLWAEVCREAGLWHEAVGSVHLAVREDELAVLEEFCGSAPSLGYEVEMLGREEAISRCPVARKDAVIGGMYSASEMCVDPPASIAGLTRWLSERHGVRFRFGEAVTRVHDGTVHLGSGVLNADRVILCTGSDMEHLFPEVYANSGIRRCKLQMLAAEAPMNGWRLGPMVAGGLTLRHYENFAGCRSLAALKERVAREQPELDRLGIHVMASQHASGEIILGDSHEYDEAMTPFDRAEIDELILGELRRFVELPNWRIVRRWHGVYAKLPGQPLFMADPAPGVRVVAAAGGTGMTMSFGLAEAMWENWDEYRV